MNSHSTVNDPRVWAPLLCLFYRSGEITELGQGCAAIVCQSQNSNPSGPAPTIILPSVTARRLSLWNKKRMLRETGQKWSHQENSWSPTSALFPRNLGHCLPSPQQRSITFFRELFWGLNRITHEDHTVVWFVHIKSWVNVCSYHDHLYHVPCIFPGPGGPQEIRPIARFLTHRAYRLTLDSHRLKRCRPMTQHFSAC